MPGIVLTLPIVTGKVEAWRRFCQELSGSRRQTYEASRRRLGITREQLALVETAFGSASVTTLEAEDVGLALAEMMSSNLPFESWYRERLQDVHGVNLTRYEQFAQPAPPAQPQQLLFEWPLPVTVSSEKATGLLQKSGSEPNQGLSIWNIAQTQDRVEDRRTTLPGAPMKTGQLNHRILEDHTMNNDEFEGQWKQMRGQVKEWWGKLTDDDLERVGGKLDQLLGVVQEKYGYTRERVEKEFNGRMAKFEADQKQSSGPTPTQDILEGKWKQMRGQAREWWGKLTDDDLDRVAGKSEKVIGLLQEKYGYTRAHAEEEFNKRMAEYEASQKKSAAPTP